MPWQTQVILADSTPSAQRFNFASGLFLPLNRRFFHDPSVGRVAIRLFWEVFSAAVIRFFSRSANNLALRTETTGFVALQSKRLQSSNALPAKSP